jgi:hypothetical protein
MGRLSVRVWTRGRSSMLPHLSPSFFSPRSFTRKDQRHTRRAATTLQTTSGCGTYGISSTQHCRDLSFWDLKGGIVLPRTVRHPDDAGIGWGDALRCHVPSFLTGTALTFFELMVLRSYYLGMLKDQRPEIWPLFFRVDWAPPILKFLLRSEGKHYDCRGTLMKGTNHVVHPVYLCLLSVYLCARLWHHSSRAGCQTECPARRSCVWVVYHCQIALVVGIAGIILGGLATLRQLMKVIHLGGEHCSIATNYCG